MEWSKQWLDNIDTIKMDLFPLQFANADRIEKNPAVFIFDETGSGKTVSTGIMVLHYLYNHPDKNCCVFTIPSLVSGGQFINDWFTMLPFKELGLDKRIFISNDVYSNIINAKGDYGIIVLDEAHRYLTAEARRKALMGIKAERAVFMTATPVKKNADEDLNNFCDLAESICSCKIDRHWIKQMIADKNEEKTICSVFDESLPVTRYFKDTIIALQHTKEGRVDFEKMNAIRKIPELWWCDGEEKRIDALLEGIRTKRLEREDGLKSRFIIFTRFIQMESDLIANAMSTKADFIEYDGEEHEENEFTYVSINGSSFYNISDFSDNGENVVLPDIIIITYQIAEAGVNLPGYNYVINYHIPSYPASLEQRFGRVDRLGKTKYSELHMVYLLTKDLTLYDYNFYEAVRVCRGELLTNIPAKNTILTKEIIGAYHEFDKLIKQKDYLASLRMKCEDEDSLKIAIDYLTEREKSDDKCNEIAQFCIDHEIYVPRQSQDTAWLKEQIIETIDGLSPILPETDAEEGEQDDSVINEWLNQIGDRVYYFDKDKLLHTIDPIHQCVKWIYPPKTDSIGEYEKYALKFSEDIKKAQATTELWYKYKDTLEKYFEEQFLANDVGNFDNIFVYDYSALIRQKVFNNNLDDEKEMFIKCCGTRKKIMELPFFQVARIFGECICDECTTKDGFFKERLDTGKYTFGNALFNTRQKIRVPDLLLKDVLNKKTWSKVFFTRCTDKENKVFESSNWLKLAFISLQDYLNPGVVEHVCAIRAGIEGTDFRPNNLYKQGHKDVFYQIFIGKTSYATELRGCPTNLREGFWEETETKSKWTNMLPANKSTFNGVIDFAYNFFDSDLKESYHKMDFWSMCIYKMLCEPGEKSYPIHLYGEPFGNEKWINTIRRYEEISKKAKELD